METKFIFKVVMRRDAQTYREIAHFIAQDIDEALMKTKNQFPNASIDSISLQEEVFV